MACLKKGSALMFDTKPYWRGKKMRKKIKFWNLNRRDNERKKKFKFLSHEANYSFFLHFLSDKKTKKSWFVFIFSFYSLPNRP